MRRVLEHCRGLSDGQQVLHVECPRLQQKTQAQYDHTYHDQPCGPRHLGHRVVLNNTGSLPLVTGGESEMILISFL